MFLRVPINTIAHRICVTLHLQAGNMLLVFSLSFSNVFFSFFLVAALKTEEINFNPHIYLQQELSFFLTSIRHQDALCLKGGDRPTVLTSAYPRL